MRNRMRFSLDLLFAGMVVSLAFVAGCLVGGPLQNDGASGQALFDQAWKAIYQNYVEPSSLDSANLSHGAIQGLMDALNDPYSAFLDPEEYTLFQSSVQGEFEGIGAEVSLNSDNLPVITAPFGDSPAVKAGIKSGDVVLAVDNQSTRGMNLLEVVLEIRGPAGTTVTLTVIHEGETTPVDIPIVREKITAPSVISERKGDIAYIHILQFGDKTNEEVNSALESANLSTAKGIILDLRNNPGGLVSTVVDVASHFINDGVVITLVDNKGRRTSESVNPNGVFTDLPMVVLVDEFSASGSEVLTGALMDHGRATVAGVKTFGKGSYDIDIPLRDGSDIYLTVGRWLTPDGHAIEGRGIMPDYVLTETGDAEVQWAIDFLENRQ